jgi:hypothetical protein
MVSPLQRFLVRPPLRALLLNDLVALLLEHVRASLEEQDAENILLEFRRIHFPAEDVRCGEQVAFKFLKSKFGHQPCAPTATWSPLVTASRFKSTIC